MDNNDIPFESKTDEEFIRKVKQQTANIKAKKKQAKKNRKRNAA